MILMNRHTFVVLAYKQSEHLEACLQSIRNQSEECGIVISTSTPSGWLEQIAQQYDIPVIISQAETGIANDWNFALSTADSEYVTLAHQDDVFHEDYAKNVRTRTQKHPNNAIVFCNYAELLEEKPRKCNLNLIVKRFLLLSMYIHSSMKHRWSKRMILSFGNPICCPSVTYHKSVIPNFRFSSSYPINLDWDAWLRIAEMSGSFVYLKKLLFYHRIHSLSETSSGIQDNRRHMDDRKIFGRLWPSPIARLLSFVYALSYKSNRS